MFNKEILEAIVKRYPDSFPAVKLLENFHLFEEIYKVIDGKWIYGCGSYLFDGQTYKYNPLCLRKQEELYRYAMGAKNVLEIGVYLGHSLLIMLLANPNLKITAIDIDDRFSGPVIEFLNRVFRNRITFIHGEAIASLKNLPYNTYDLVHIDADHYDDAVKAQFIATMPLAVDNAIYIFDDYDAVSKTINGFVDDGILEHLVTPNCLWRNTITKLVARNKIDGIVKIATMYSACSDRRLKLNIEAVEQVNKENIEGSIVEIGVYKGGSMLSMMRANLFSHTAREFYLYDTFEGMTPPCDFDKDLNGYDAKELLKRDYNTRCISTLGDVKSMIEKFSNTPSEKIHYVVGDICETKVFPDKIAILRLDTDFYESTAFELANFYDKVESGGYIIIDDYGHWQGCKKAVDEFLINHPNITLVKIDYTGVYFRKP